MWDQNRNFDKIITFEPDGISKRVERRFVHLGEVNTQTELYQSEATIEVHQGHFVIRILDYADAIPLRGFFW